MSLKSLIKNNENEFLYQNALRSSAPDYCPHPYPYVRGCEKVCRCGRKDFNYIDYMEAYANINCNTHRSRDSLIMIRKEIEAALAEE